MVTHQTIVSSHGASDDNDCCIYDSVATDYSCCVEWKVKNNNEINFKHYQSQESTRNVVV